MSRYASLLIITLCMSCASQRVDWKAAEHRKEERAKVNVIAIPVMVGFMFLFLANG